MFNLHVLREYTLIDSKRNLKEINFFTQIENDYRSRRYLR